MQTLRTKDVTIIERGWAAHYISSFDCAYRRNTLLIFKDQSIIVSSVGNMLCPKEGTLTEIGANRHYETMAFVAVFSGGYLEADTNAQVAFDSEWRLFVDENSAPDCPWDAIMDSQHEAVVTELANKMVTG